MTRRQRWPGRGSPPPCGEGMGVGGSSGEARNCCAPLRLALAPRSIQFPRGFTPPLTPPRRRRSEGRPVGGCCSRRRAVRPRIAHDPAGSRPLGVRLRVADVAAGVRLRGGAARPPHRLPALLLHLLGASPRHGQASGHGAGSRPRRRVRGHRLSRGGGERRRDRALSAGARAGQRRLSRGACAGRADRGPAARGAGAHLHRRAGAPELRRTAAARPASPAHPRRTRPLRQQPRLSHQHAAASARSSASASASWSGCWR